MDTQSTSTSWRRLKSGCLCLLEVAVPGFTVDWRAFETPKQLSCGSCKAPLSILHFSSLYLDAFSLRQSGPEDGLTLLETTPPALQALAGFRNHRSRQMPTSWTLEAHLQFNRLANDGASGMPHLKKFVRSTEWRGVREDPWVEG